MLPNDDLPDLSGYAEDQCVWPDFVLHLVNRGLRDAGPFMVSGVDVRFDGLAAGESITMTIHDPRTPMLIDADDGVFESDESNNEIGRVVPSCLRNFLPHLSGGH